MLPRKHTRPGLRNVNDRLQTSTASERDSQRAISHDRPTTPDDLIELRAQRDSARRDRYEAEMAGLRTEIENDRAATKATLKQPVATPTRTAPTQTFRTKADSPAHSSSKATALIRQNEPSTIIIDIEDSASEKSADGPPESWYSEIPLGRAAARYLWLGLATKTRGLYETGRQSYRNYCLQVSIAPYPITVEKLAGWLAHLGDRGLEPKTIKGYLAAVRSSHVDIGFEDSQTFHAPLLGCIIAGIRRDKDGEAEKQERMPITREVLLMLLRSLKQTNRAHATLHAAYCLAFAAFLRVGEITHTPTDIEDSNFGAWHLTRRSVQLETDKLYISVPSSKTDPFRRGITLTVAASGDPACAVASLHNLFTKFPLPPEAPLFQTYTNGGSFTRQYLTSALRSGLKNLGIENDNYSAGYSFRRGAAIAAKEAGLCKEEIQVLGRWRADSYRLYLQTHQSHILNASRRIQRAAAAATLDHSDQLANVGQMGLLSPP